jgi:hypothetical protein
MHQNLRSGHAYIGPSGEGAGQICEPIRFRFRVVIEQRDELGVGRSEALVVRRAETPIVWIADQLESELGRESGTFSDEPSSDPLSTTTTSNGWFKFCRVSDCKHDLKRLIRFQVTITTEIAPK